MNHVQIILVRHGQTIWNQEGRRQGQRDSPLTEKGYSQAEEVAAKLGVRTHQAIYSSDLQRAYQTAQRISQKIALPVVVDARLRERDFGILEGLTVEEVKKYYPEEFLLFRTGGDDYVIPNGESASQFFHRCIECLEDLKKNHSEESIIVVTHFGVINCILEYLQVTPEAPAGISVEEGSFHLLHFNGDKWTLGNWTNI